ncbi:MAG: hypothetical protein JNN13_10270 [Planctomycetes bacterium]|nr:hypothetical protein [Planctomycetota bacterium]
MTRFTLSSLLSTCVAATVSLGLATAQDAGTANDNGFLTGLRGFEKFHEPLGQPIYFESPFNDTGLRALYIKHNFSDDSTLAGGDVTIYALQARLAITERLAFIATKDGYSEFDSGIIQDEGWNDLAGGFKYVAIADTEKNFVVTPGIRLMAEHGHRGILQGGVGELSPFVSAAKGYDDLHVLANVTLRLPADGDDGNTVLHWDLHADYDVNPQDNTVFAPLFELHAVHYLDDGASALNVGGLDYANLGSTPEDSMVAWATIGARVEINKKYEIGACYEFALTDPDKDIMESRFSLDFIARW